MTQAALPLPVATGPDPRLLAEIEGLDLIRSQRRILVALAKRDQSPRELEVALELTPATVAHHLAELGRRRLVSRQGFTWGLSAAWVEGLGLSAGRPACVTA